jgi:hypothetical protein
MGNEDHPKEFHPQDDASQDVATQEAVHWSREVAKATRENPTKDHDPERPWNRPDISPIELLQEVMRTDLLSMPLRMKAAKYLAFIEAQAPQSACTIRIPYDYSDEYLKRFPFLKEYIQ